MLKKSLGLDRYSQIVWAIIGKVLGDNDKPSLIEVSVKKRKIVREVLHPAALGAMMRRGAETAGQVNSSCPAKAFV